MSQKISLKQAERQVFKTATNDGLWDIFIGSFFLQFAIAPLLSRSLGDFWSSFVFLPFWALVLISIWLLRKHVVIPRIGFVKFGATRKKKLTKFTFLMLVANLIALILGLFLALNPNVISGYIYPILLGFTILVFSSIAAYFLNFARLFIYGLLFLISLMVGEWLFVNFKVSHHGFPITFGISAGIIIITGLIIFYRLLRENPVPVNESISGENMG
jgi:MFS family permease